MSGQITIVFPKPVGKSNAILTLHSEVATLPVSYKDKGIKKRQLPSGTAAGISLKS